MGVVKRRRSRKLLEKRESTEADGKDAGSSAAAAWGNLLEQGSLEGEDPPPPPQKADEELVQPKVEVRPPRESRRITRSLPEFLRTPSPELPKRRKIEEVVGSITDEQADYDGESEFAGAASFGLNKSRWLFSVVVLVVATVVAGFPVYSEWSRRQQVMALQSVLADQAAKIAEAETGLAALVDAEDVLALREIYATHQPRVVKGVQGAGFVIDANQVRLRLDFKASALVLGVSIEPGESDDPVAAEASTTGKPVGRTLPSPSLGAVLSEHVEDVVPVYLMALVLILAIFLAPPLVARLKARQRQTYAELRSKEEREAFERATRDG